MRALTCRRSSLPAPRLQEVCCRGGGWSRGSRSFSHWHRRNDALFLGGLCGRVSASLPGCDGKTLAYVSIRQHTSAYVRACERLFALMRRKSAAPLVSVAYARLPKLLRPTECTEHTSALVSTRQQTSSSAPLVSVGYARLPKLLRPTGMRPGARQLIS